MKRHEYPVRWSGRGAMLRVLLAEARTVRRERLRGQWRSTAEDSDRQLPARRRRAALLIERMLSRRLPDHVDCARYLDVLASRHQLGSGKIASMMTSVQPLVLNAVRARALAVALADLFHFVEVGVPAGGHVDVYLAVALDEECLVVGLGVVGDMHPV